MIWLLFNTFNILALLWCFLTNWLAAAFVDAAGNLPRWLTWYGTPDSNQFGADGDKGFRDRHAHLLGTWIWRWLVCTKWLYRNTANGFRENVLGFRPGTNCKLTLFEGANTKYAWEYSVAINKPDSWLWPVTGRAWQFYFVWYWNDKKRFRMNIGWKLWTMGVRPRCMIVFSISPYVNR